jgi:hypothetical protein
MTEEIWIISASGWLFKKERGKIAFATVLTCLKIEVIIRKLFKTYESQEFKESYILRQFGYAAAYVHSFCMLSTCKTNERMLPHNHT